MFRRRNEPDPQPAARPTPPASDWDPLPVRETLFSLLSDRLGKANGKAIQLDFEKHIEADPIHGVEQAYVCLLGKLIEYTDALNEQSVPLGDVDVLSMPIESQPIAGVNDFTVYRKN